MSHRDHEMYRDEAADASGELTLIRFSDVPKLTRRERVMIETAYRRGFQQGAATVVHSMESGLTVQAACTYVYGALHSWRFCKHRGRFTDPPRPKQWYSKA